MASTKPDNVNHPAHYTQGGVECIDAMEAAFGKKVVADFCKCNVFKYTFRSGMKQPKESIEKAEWYLKKYMELAEEFLEEWRVCSNGLYEVSNLGNVRGVGADENRKKITLKNGYDTVMFSINGKVNCHYVHRLVAEAFIPNPNNLLQVNHKNHIRTDNRAENLEWITNKENQQDAFGTTLYVYNTDGDFIGKYNSIRDCEAAFDFSHSSLDIYIDTALVRGNMVFYTKELGEDDIKQAQWYKDKDLELLNNS